jgi:hypothetical protein
MFEMAKLVIVAADNWVAGALLNKVSFENISPCCMPKVRANRATFVGYFCMARFKISV